MTATQAKNSAPLRARDYAAAQQRLRRHGAPIYGHTGNFPLYWIELAPRPASCLPHHVLISAGIHGDEPAGVEAALRLIEQRPKWTEKLHLTVFPCLNPWGYEHNARTNARGRDLNREFRNSSPPPEVAAYIRALRCRHFALSMALHEDCDGEGFYLYELCPRSQEFGERIIERITAEKILPIHFAARVEGRRNRGGVIHRWPERYRPERRKRWPEAFYVYCHHVAHHITTESPSKFLLEDRVRAQLCAVRVACEKIRRAAR